jgi:hypothetical protein
MFFSPFHFHSFLECLHGTSVHPSGLRCDHHGRHFNRYAYHETYVFLTVSRCYFPVSCVSFLLVLFACTAVFLVCLVIRLYFVPGAESRSFDLAFFGHCPAGYLRPTIHATIGLRPHVDRWYGA